MLGICFFVTEPRDADVIRPTFRDWNDLGKAFGVDQIMYVDPYQPQNTGYPNLIRHVDLTSAMDSTPDVPWFFAEYAEPSSIVLTDFAHPTDAVYCFGSDREGLNKVDHNLGSWISIPTKHSLWANQAAAVVLGHRQFNGNNR